MKIKRFALQAGVTAGVILGMKYVFPVMLPFLLGWILAEAVHPLAKYMAGRIWSRKLHIKESGFGALFILVFTVAGIGLFLIGAEYITGKIGECMEYYPEIKAEAGALVGQCCQGVEKLTGIPAAESKAYIFREMEEFQQYLLEEGISMSRAVDGVKVCVTVLGGFIIGIVSAILFLQEREKIQKFLGPKNFYQKSKRLGRELLEGGKGYLKAQFKITGLICLVCIGGLWILKFPYFFGMGLAVGILDALPVLGTGTFLIPAGIFLLFQGKTAKGIGLFLIYIITAGIRQILEPRLIGSQVGISPLLILLSVYLGVILYGGFGFILGPLSALLLYGIFREWNLLGWK